MTYLLKARQFGVSHLAYKFSPLSTTLYAGALDEKLRTTLSFLSNLLKLNDATIPPALSPIY